MKSFIKKLLRESLLFEKYFNPTLSKDVKKFSKKFEGRNVVWYGDPDQMIVIHKDSVEGMWGNIYYPEKLEQLSDLILNYEGKVELECSYGHGGVIDLTDVVEEQQAYLQDRFEVDYDGKNRPASLGDDDLNRYVGTEEIGDLDFISSYVTQQEVQDFFENYWTSFAKGRVSLDQLKEEFKQLEPSEEEVEAFREFIELESGVKEAIENKRGDIGKFTVQLRDGHHRVTAAINAGEEYICVNLDKEHIEKYKGYYKKV